MTISFRWGKEEDGGAAGVYVVDPGRSAGNCMGRECCLYAEFASGDGGWTCCGTAGAAGGTGGC